MYARDGPGCGDDGARGDFDLLVVFLGMFDDDFAFAADFLVGGWEDSACTFLSSALCHLPMLYHLQQHGYFAASWL